MELLMRKVQMLFDKMELLFDKAQLFIDICVLLKRNAGNEKTSIMKEFQVSRYCSKQP